ncbi:MAG: carboxypeptidase regulatory-like domain-containing protein, partial [Chitinophagaceae bacterium]
MINRLIQKCMMPLVGNLLSIAVMAQTGNLSGTVTDKNSLQALPGITVNLKPGDAAKTTDSKGSFRFTDIKPGTYNLEITAVGYLPKTLNNLVITSGNENTLGIELEPSVGQLSTIVVSGRKNTAKATSLESPLSIQRLTTEDIKTNPGGNFDISRVIQSLPGVGGGVGGGGFRNDVIIRGGAP